MCQECFDDVYASVCGGCRVDPTLGRRLGKDGKDAGKGKDGKGHVGYDFDRNIAPLIKKTAESMGCSAATRTGGTIAASALLVTLLATVSVTLY